MRNLFAAMALASGLLLFAPLAAARAQNGPKLSEQRMKQLAKSLQSDDAHERTTSVMILMDLAERDPASWPRLQAEAVPALREALRKEIATDNRPELAELMKRAIDKIERIDEPDEPAPEQEDPDSVAARVHRLLEQLKTGTEIQKQKAINQLRKLKALAEPALPRLKKIAAESKDKLTQTTAGKAIKEISEALWFRTLGDEEKDEELTLEQVRERIGSVVSDLSDKLEDKSLSIKLKTLRQLATMKAAAADVVPKLEKITEDPEASKAVKLAARAALKSIELSKEAAARYKAWKQKKDSDSKNP
ncbi:MAG: hypothetical protein R3236_08660 [Phycisphaeraceae bacterium]|nr:hypothetical protein [Phycisphaeraceae bacterium]